MELPDQASGSSERFLPDHRSLLDAPQGITKVLGVHPLDRYSCKNSRAVTFRVGGTAAG